MRATSGARTGSSRRHLSESVKPSPARAEPHDATSWLPLPDLDSLPALDDMVRAWSDPSGRARPAESKPSPARAEPHDPGAWLPLPSDLDGLPSVEELLTREPWAVRRSPARAEPHDADELAARAVRPRQAPGDRPAPRPGADGSRAAPEAADAAPLLISAVPPAPPAPTSGRSAPLVVAPALRGAHGRAVRAARDHRRRCRLRPAAHHRPGRERRRARRRSRGRRTDRRVDGRRVPARAARAASGLTTGSSPARTHASPTACTSSSPAASRSPSTSTATSEPCGRPTTRRSTTSRRI